MLLLLLLMLLLDIEFHFISIPFKKDNETLKPKPRLFVIPSEMAYMDFYFFTSAFDSSSSLCTSC